MSTHANERTLKYFCYRLLSCAGANALNLQIFTLKNATLHGGARLKIISPNESELRFIGILRSKAKVHRIFCWFFNFECRRITDTFSKIRAKTLKYKKKSQKIKILKRWNGTILALKLSKCCIQWHQSFLKKRISSAGAIESKLFHITGGLVYRLLHQIITQHLHVYCLMSAYLGNHLIR